MNCRVAHSKLADLLFEPESVAARVHDHVAACADCSRELDGLRATMKALDAWEAPEPSPFFDTRLQAGLRAEKNAAPAGFFERLRAQILFGSNWNLRPVAATALTVVLAVSGAGYAGLLHLDKPTRTSAAVGDLQTLDKNQQVFQQLDTLDDDDDGPSAN